MLLNENPERDDEMMESDQENQESTTQSQDQASEQDADQQPPAEPAMAEKPVATELEPTAEEAPQVTQPKSGTETASEGPVAPDAAAESSEKFSSETKKESFESTKEADAEHPPAPDGHDTIISRIDALLTSQEPGAQILTDVSIPKLIQLVRWMAHNPNLNQHVSRVGLIRHAFDALKAADSLNHSMETDFRGAFAEFNKLRSLSQQSNSGVRKDNAAKKRDLITALRDIVKKKNPELVNEVRSIQDQWKTIGQVPQQDLESLYREYRSLLDEFYELRSVHLELIEYDRKKNLEERERLIEIAKTLVPAEDDREKPEVWKEKLDLLQELQQEWKSAGHVPRDDMDRINEAYRDAIDGFFEVRQGFRKIEDKQREVNAEKKEEIFKQLEDFREYQGESPKAWNETTKQVRKLQEAWKEIGPGPSKINGDLWSRYKEVCNAFYGNKSAFFKGLDEQREENLKIKTDLAEKAEGISRRTDWEQAAKALKALQREWKSIGPVPEKHSKKLWERFRSACDVFFEARREHYSELHAQEKENLAYRRTLIDEVKKLQEAENMNPGEIVNSIKEIQARWKESGRVPYKEKEKIWKEFRREIDTIFSGLDSRRGESRVERTVNRIENIDNDDERTRAIKGNIARIRKKIRAAEEKVDQYSTNIQFIAKGKSGDKLRAQIQGEIDKEKQSISGLKKEIKALDEILKNPPEEDKSSEEKQKPEPAPTGENKPAAAASDGSESTKEEAKPQAEASGEDTLPAVASEDSKSTTEDSANAGEEPQTEAEQAEATSKTEEPSKTPEEEKK